MSKIRVLHCIYKINSGGVEQRRLTLAKRLDPARYEQKIVCLEALGGLPSQFDEAGCEVSEVGATGSILSANRYIQVLRIIKKYKPHIIHGAVYEGFALAAVSGWVGGVPIVIGEETSNPTNRSWRGNALYRIFASLCCHMVGVSSSAVDYLTATVGLHPNKVSLINNGASERELISTDEVMSLRSALGFSSDSFIIGTVGRVFDDPKRISDLLRALAIISKENANVYLLVVGSGPDEGALKRLAQDLGIVRNVIFVGYQANPQPYYQMMNLFALASVRESFGLVLVEAMFAELAVVATRVGGIPSVVEEGDTGYLVRPCQPKEFASSILKLIDNPSLRKSMGVKGRQRAIEYFSADRYVRDVDALYTDLLLGRNFL